MLQITPNLPLKLIDWNIIVVFADNGFCYFPDLDKVVFGCTTNDPGFVGIPAEVSQVVRVASVHKEPV